MKSRLLVIDDEIMICKALKEYGEEFENYDVDYAINITQVIEALSTQQYDLITLDMKLGTENGLDVLKLIEGKTACPVIFVSAVYECITVVRALELGAEDYIKKPFDINELFTRINKIVKRRSLMHVANNEIKVADYFIDDKTKEVMKNGKKLEIFGKAYDILLYLLKNPNRTVTRNELYQELWGGTYDYSSRVIDAHIKSVRYSTMDYRIMSVRGQGYKFELLQEK